MTVYGSVLDLIGNTPLVDIIDAEPQSRRPDPDEARGPEPGGLGQGPDRPGHDRAGRAGRDPHAREPTLIEPSSGNTGIGMALVCRIKGYQLKVVLATNVSDRAPPAARVVGRRDHRVARGRGLQRGRAPGPGPGRGASRVDLPLPVRQPGQPEGPLRGHRPRDLARLPRDHPLRGRPRHLGHPARAWAAS